MKRLWDESTCMKTGSSFFYPYIFPSPKGARGVHTTFIVDLAKRFDFCYDIQVTHGADFGFAKNGSYTGFLLQTVMGELDVNMDIRNNINPTDGDYLISEPVDYMGRSALMPYPVIKADLAGFIKTLGYKVWILLFLFIMMTILAFILLPNLYNKIMDARNTEKINEIDTSNAIMKSIKIILNQSFGEQAYEVWYRILCGSALIFALFITLIYKSNMKANLILPRFSLPFTNLYEMVEQDRYGWVIARGVVLGKVAKSAMEGTAFRKFGDGINTEKPIDSVAAVYQLMEEDKHVFVSAEPGIKFFVQDSYKKNKKCTMTSMKEIFYIRPGSWFMAINTPFKDLINFGIVAYHESGIFEYEKKNYLTLAERCSKISNKGIKRPLALKDFYGVFLVYIIGIIFGSVSFIFETLHGK